MIIRSTGFLRQRTKMMTNKEMSMGKTNYQGQSLQIGDYVHVAQRGLGGRIINYARGRIDGIYDDGTYSVHLFNSRASGNICVPGSDLEKTTRRVQYRLP